MNYFYEDFFFTLLLCFTVNFFLHKISIHEHFLGPLGFNIVRSLICGSLATNSYHNYKLVMNDICLVNNYELFQNYHYKFFNYFIIDIFIMFYQKYCKIVPYIRMDLLFHHFLAIFVLLIIQKQEMYSLSVLIGLSEGMSLVSGFKLLSNYFENKKFTKIFIYYRLLYCIVVRMFFLWPSLFFLYLNMTSQCEKFKNKRNIFMILSFIGIIMFTESKWIYKGKKELFKI
jgi:hypothetical protein